MCQFIESIAVVDGIPQNLAYHQARVEHALHIWGGDTLHLPLKQCMESLPHMDGKCKARIIYNDRGELITSQIAPYKMRKISSLQLVIDNDIDYSFKWTDRSSLANLVARKGEADEIIIVRNGLLTDTSYSNIALFDGTRWYTPSQPLLRGTMRQYLLDEDRLSEADIPAEELSRYTHISLINAMMPLGECQIPVSQVFLI